MKQGARLGALVLAGIGYSLLAHRAAASGTPGVLNALVAVVPLLGLALLMAWRSAHRVILLALWLAGCATLYGLRDWLLANYQWVFLLEHAGVHALLGLAFAKTLRAGHEPMVTRFARVVHTTMSPALLAYTRTVTWAWTFYFLGMSSLSLLLFALAPIAVWSTVANLLGVPLLVLMFAAEYAVRCRVLPAEDRAGPLEAIRAYRQAWSTGSARQP